MNRVLDKLSDSILVLDKDGNIKFYNKSFLELLEYDRDLLNKNNITDILVDKSKWQYIRMNFNNKCILSLIKRDGNEVNVEVDITLDKWNSEDVIFITFKNYKIQNDLKIKKALEYLLEESPVGYWIKDLEGKCLYLNNKTTEFLNVSKNDMLGKTGEKSLSQEKYSRIKNSDDCIVQSKKKQVHKYFINRGEENTILL